MDALTLAEIDPARCPWPCGLWIIASVIIILAAIKNVVQWVVQFFQSRKAGGSNK